MFLARDGHKIRIIGGLLLTGLTLAAGIALYDAMQPQTESTLGKGLEVALHGRARLFDSQIAHGLVDMHAVVTHPPLIQALQQFNAQPGSTNALHDPKQNVNSLPLASFTAVAVYDVRVNKLTQVGHFSRNQAVSLPLNTHDSMLLVWDEQLILRVRKDVLDQGGLRIGSIMAEKSCRN